MLSWKGYVIFKHKKYESRKQNKDSFIKKHQVDRHNDRPAQFKAKVTGVFKVCLSHHISEGVEIEEAVEMYSTQKVSGNSLPCGASRVRL